MAIALFTSRGWIQSADAVDDPTLRAVATGTTALVYTQIIVGAAMRHSGAGLAIPDFPLMFGGIVPDHWNGAIAIHFTHRVGALVVAAAVLATAGAHLVSPSRAGAASRGRRSLLVGLVAVQITLGALTVLSRRDVAINSAHVVCGALVLATSLVITLRTWRVRFAEVRLKPDTTNARANERSVRLQPDSCSPRAKAGSREERAGRGGSGDVRWDAARRTSRRLTSRSPSRG